MGGNEYDIYSTSFPLTINGTLNELTEKNSEAIKAYLKFKNTNKEQNEIMNKDMTLTFSAESFSCIAEESESTSLVNTLINTVSSDVLWKSTLEDDGYRYVGTNPNNYICFGTSDKNTCTGDTDKYMYRIIGIFEDNAGKKYAKLIKKEALNTAYGWHSLNTEKEWNDSDLNNGLNGNYFLTNTTYMPSGWSNKISMWNYTIANSKMFYAYSPSDVFGVSYWDNTSQIVYLHELNKPSKSSNTCYYDSTTIVDCDFGEWKNSSAKIGLMYASDYMLSLGNSALNYTSRSNYNTLKTGWMNITNNDSTPAGEYEQLMDILGLMAGAYSAYALVNTGEIDNMPKNIPGIVRPVFYLESDVELASNSGTGTLTNPYLIN